MTDPTTDTPSVLDADTLAETTADDTPTAPDDDMPTDRLEDGYVNPHARPAERFHWLYTGMIWRAKAPQLFGTASEISQRGQTVTITAEMLEASPWIARVLGDDAAQIAKWGEVRIAPGPFPEDVSRYVHGAPDWEEAREAARRRAWAISDPEERAAARAEIERLYGPAPTTSQTVEIREHHTVKAAREQAERRARGGADRRH